MGSRFFVETGFSVSDSDGVRFLSEFDRFGGVGAVGYPASRRFTWDGFTVQVFQRVIFQWRPESHSVAFVNVFDRLHEAGYDDWLASVRQTPPPGSFADAGLSWDAAAALRLRVLDRDPAIKHAYFDVVGDPIQANGLPVSDIVDFGNHVALRSQRVVFQRWKVGVPWARAGQVTVALGGDIAKEAGILPDRAALVPETAPSHSFAASIVIDPGHGGAESGAARDVPVLIEKDVTLDIARRLAVLLRGLGHRVTLTRTADAEVNVPALDRNGDRRIDVDDDLQARVDIANDADADLFVSLHSNGGPPALRGVATYYCADCTDSTRHRSLAVTVQSAAVEAVRPYGGGAFGAGVYDEAGLGKPYGHLFVIGPKTPRVARPNRAEAQALVEMLFVSNAADAALLARSDVRGSLAEALARAVEAYLSERR